MIQYIFILTPKWAFKLRIGYWQHPYINHQNLYRPSQPCLILGELYLLVLLLTSYSNLGCTPQQMSNRSWRRLWSTLYGLGKAGILMIIQFNIHIQIYQSLSQCQHKGQGQFPSPRSLICGLISLICGLISGLISLIHK